MKSVFKAYILCFHLLVEDAFEHQMRCAAGEGGRSTDVGSIGDTDPHTGTQPLELAIITLL